MSSLIVQVCRIDALRPHPNADRLEIASVKGWQCVVPRGRYRVADLVTYIPIDAVLPLALSDKLGITKYLSNGRVRCASLRGEPSYGVIMDPVGGLGENVAAALGITKFVPPLRLNAGDAEPTHPMFDGYTDVENMRNFPSVFVDGEQVVGTEKVHGSNCRVAILRDADGEHRVAGSKAGQRSRTPGSLYWFPWSLDPVAQFMNSLSVGRNQVILYGEVYGKVQDLRYGLNEGVAFRAFDAKIDGRYLDADEFTAMCMKHGVDRCPEIYRGPFSLGAIKSASQGDSTIPNANHMREGVVVRPVAERTDPRIGRVILKYVSDAYLLGGHDDRGEDS